MLLKNSLFYKYLESTAEDRYRESKGLPRLDDASSYEILKKYKDNDKIYITFRGDQYSKTKRIGRNLDSNVFKSKDKQTPNGIYTYQLKKMWEKINHKLGKIAFYSNDNMKYFFPPKISNMIIMELNKSANVLNLKTYKKTDFDIDFKKLKNKYPKLKQPDEIISNFSNKNIYIRPLTIKKNNLYYAILIWMIIFYIYKYYLKSNNTNVFSKIITDDLGYDCVHDEDGIIHMGVTTQTIFFNNKSYTVKESVSLKKENVDSQISDLSITPYDKNKKLFEILTKEDNEKKIISILKNYDFNYKLNGQTLLHYAVANEKVDLLKILLDDKTVNLKLTNNDKENILHIACQNKNHAIIKMILEKNKINVNIAKGDGATPLIIACENNDVKTVEMLLKFGADPNKKDSVYNFFSPISIATQNKNKKILKLLES